jgi:hypothetical protein
MYITCLKNLIVCRVKFAELDRGEDGDEGGLGQSGSGYRATLAEVLDSPWLLVIPKIVS